MAGPVNPMPAMSISKNGWAAGPSNENARTGLTPLGSPGFGVSWGTSMIRFMARVNTPGPVGP